MRCRRFIAALALAGLAGAASAQPSFVGRWECGVIMYPNGASESERTDFILHMDVEGSGRCSIQGQVKLNAQYSSVRMPNGRWSVDGSLFTCIGDLHGPAGVHEFALIAGWLNHGQLNSDRRYDWGRSITTCRAE